jgi:hypothetical protein
MARGAPPPSHSRRSERNKLLFAVISLLGMRTHAPMNILLTFFLMPQAYTLQNILIDWISTGIQILNWMMEMMTPLFEKDFVYSFSFPGVFF